MEYRQLGTSDLRVSVIAIGGWLTFGATVSDDTTAAILRTALDGGVNFIDLADVYARGGAERAAGRALRAFRRQELVISSKVFWPMSDDPADRGLGRAHIMRSIEASLARLGTDYLDLYFCHREDPDTPLEETVRAMDDLVRQGRIRAWGTSVWSPRSLKRAHRTARRLGASPPVVEQPRYNLLHRSVERKVIPMTQRLGMGLVVWSPLAGGVLTGKYRDGIPEGSRGDTTDWLREDLTDTARQRVRSFCAVADRLGHSPAVLALAWLMRRTEVASVITGATGPAQVTANLQALSVSLPEAAWREIEAIFPR